MTKLNQIIKNYFHKKENSIHTNKELNRLENNVLFMIQELKEQKQKTNSLDKLRYLLYVKPAYKYAFIAILILIGISVFVSNYAKNLPSKSYQVIIGDKKIGFKIGLGSNSIKVKVSPTPIPTPTLIPTMTPSINLGIPVYYIVDLLSFGNIKTLTTYEGTQINTLLKSYQQWGDFQIVTNQSDFSYNWTIDNPSIAQITPFEVCTNGIVSPCPQDHLTIMAKNEGFTYIRVNVTKKSENLLVATGTFNLTVNTRENTPTPTFIPTINPTSIPSPTAIPTPVPTVTSTPSLSTKCNDLFELIKKSYASSCGESNYDVRADLNKDGKVLGGDFSLFRTMVSLPNSENECALKLSDTTNVCL